MKILVLMLVLFPVSALSQNGVADLQPAHAAALQKYLAANRDKHFLPEYSMEREDLDFLRKEIRRGMKPYYLTGDFNRDRIPDFAVLVARNGRAGVNGSDQLLTLVVFNGQRRGGFYVAHTEDIEAPLTSFINLSDGRKKVLYFAIAESDAGTFSLVPAGKGYIAEPAKNP